MYSCNNYEFTTTIFCITHYSAQLQGSFMSTLYFRTETSNIQVYKTSKVYTYDGHTKLCVLNIVPPFWKWFSRLLIIIMLYFLSLQVLQAIPCFEINFLAWCFELEMINEIIYFIIFPEILSIRDSTLVMKLFCRM